MQTIEAPKPQRPSKPPRRDWGRLVSTRRGTAVVAGVSALLAASLLMVFIDQYRRSLHSGDQPVTVLVAKSLIEKGSSGTIIAEKSVYQTARIKKSDVKNGAVADPADLRGKVAADDVYPGEQLTIADFAPATGGVRERITGPQRAIALPLDTAHGLVGNVQSGDHVDVFYSFGLTGGGGGQSQAVLTLLMRDLAVLQAPKVAKAGGIGGSNNQVVVVRATDAQAAKLAYASDNGKIWLVLRPKIGATQSKSAVIDTRAILLAANPGAARAGRSR